MLCLNQYKSVVSAIDDERFDRITQRHVYLLEAYQQSDFKKLVDVQVNSIINGSADDDY